MFQRPNILFAVEWYDYEINAGVAAYAREAGWILCDATSYSDVRDRIAQPPRAWSGEGIITLVNHPDAPFARYFADLDVPVVDLVDEAPELPFPRVIPDNRAIGAMAAQYLLNIGYDHLAYQRLFPARVTDARLEGFRDTVQAAGKHAYVIDFMDSPKRINPYTDLVPWLAQELQNLPLPVGLMMQHDGESMITFMACEEAGLTIPDQIAVIGVDNNELICELGFMGLTSVDRNRRRHGYEAAALLDRLIRGEHAPQSPLLIPPKEVIPRESTHALVFQDAELLRAVRYLRTHFRNPDLAIEEVIMAAGVSRRKLYYLFDKHLGRGIHEELVRLRLEEAKHLLATTEQKIFSVAMQTGFANERQLTRACKEELGISPRIYREQRRALRHRTTGNQPAASR